MHVKICGIKTSADAFQSETRATVIKFAGLKPLLTHFNRNPRDRHQICGIKTSADAFQPETRATVN